MTQVVIVALYSTVGIWIGGLQPCSGPREVGRWAGLYGAVGLAVAGYEALLPL